MRHFRLNFALLLATVATAAALAVWLFSTGRWPLGIFALLLLCFAVLSLVSLTKKLIRLMSTFVSALEMNDVTMQFNIGEDDRELHRMSQSMNSIIELYRSNTRQLETGKLYYDRILRIMTHEMRNSITPVIAIADDIEKHPEKYDGDNLKEAISVIRSQSEGIKHFLDAYYEMTHIPVPEKTRVDAIAFFNRIKAMARIEAANRSLPENVCGFIVARDMTLDIDTALMTQALINLIRNALDAVAAVENPSVNVVVSSSDGQPYISIEDNGPGLSPEIAENMFQPFLSTKAGGSGVGLYLSRQIVRQHEGDLRLTSSRHGAIATIILPAESSR